MTPRKPPRRRAAKRRQARTWTLWAYINPHGWAGKNKRLVVFEETRTEADAREVARFNGGEAFQVLVTEIAKPAGRKKKR